VSRAK